MATESGKPGSGLIDRLLKSPQQFEFFQAVRLAEDAVYRASLEAGEEAPPAVGSNEPAAGQRPGVVLRSATMLGFPGGAISAASFSGSSADNATDLAASSERGPEMNFDVTCFGLVGASGVLPRHYTTLIVDRMRRFRDSALRHFLTIFEQRAISLLYRAWAKYRHPVQQERTMIRGIGTAWDDGAPHPRDPITAAVACLVGLGGRGLGQQLTVDDESIFRYAGHYAHFPRSAESLELMLSDLYKVPVQVHQFIGRWLSLEQPDQTRLGFAGHPDGLNARLGFGAIAGARVWNVQSIVELSIGPLSLADFRDRLPGTTGLAAIGDLARLFVGLEFHVRLRPLLRAGEVPMTQLGGNPLARDSAPAGSRLGWTTWILSEPSAFDRSDAAFAIMP